KFGSTSGSDNSNVRTEHTKGYLSISLRGEKNIEDMSRTFFMLIIGVLTFQLGFSQARNNALNGIWQFKTDPHNNGLREEWFKEETARSVNWDSLAVPGNWDVRNEYAEYAGKAWYKREFNVEKGWQDRNVRLFFESVYNEATVWVNGKEVGRNELGFLPFSFDINTFLNFEGKNIIVVLVDNTLKRGAMWNWGGIRRPVWLETTDKVRFEYQHVSAIPNFEKKLVPIHLSFELNNLGQEVSALEYSWEIQKDGVTIWKQNRRKQLQ